MSILKNITLACTLGILSACVSAPATTANNIAAPTITFVPYEFQPNDGEAIMAERGTFMVPENRADPNSRPLKLGFVRFKSTNPNPGSPIVYLAGGPGGSGVGTARGRRFPLFMAMREFGDVIAFDQRGTNWSKQIPACETNHQYPLTQPLIREKYIALLKSASDECSTFWRDQGVDLAAYNSMESARDISDLRRALEAEKISLWGISYGSHLAFATLKVMPDHIDQVVLTAIEGLEATVKLPARTDTYFERLQAAINLDPGAASAYPDLAALMRRVFAKLDKTPIESTVTNLSGEKVTMAVGKMDMQIVASMMIADPASAANLPGTFAMAEVGDVSKIAPLIYRYIRKDALKISGMPEAMDIMSGISTKRLALVEEQAKTSLLGDLLNFPMPHLMGAFGLRNPDPDYWLPLNTNVRTLILTSTLDGRTYPAGAKYAISGFTNATHVMIENGGHNVFMQSPEISDLIISFMRNEPVGQRISLEPPKFPH